VRDALGVARSPDGLDVLDVRQARAFLQKHLREPVSLLARRFDLSEHQAETLLPSLAVYLALADAVGARRLHVGDATLRDGILTEMFGGREWEGEFRRQTVNSALALARRYHVDRRHCGQVAQYAGRLYDFVGRHVALEPADAILLQVAALLHEIGMFVNSRSHHKHTLYLIENSDIFGLGARDIALVARIARYHRRAMPQPTHEEFTTLAPEDRVRLEKLAAILRVADALACLRETEAVPLEFRLRRDELEILAWTTDDLTLAQRQLASRAEMFETVYGWRVTLGRGRALEQSHAGA
jgi:exopolyphosphatase/guanosine-5'-triphosphate,3'-diphosphate pyrophosphatase